MARKITLLITLALLLGIASVSACSSGPRPFDVKDARVRSLTAFSGKGWMFIPEMHWWLETWFDRPFTAAEIEEFRDNVDDKVVALFEDLYAKGKIDLTVLEFYRKPQEQIKSEYLRDFPYYR